MNSPAIFLAFLTSVLEYCFGQTAFRILWPLFLQFLTKSIDIDSLHLECSPIPEDGVSLHTF